MSPAAELDLLDDPVEQQRFTRWRETPGGTRLAESAFLLSGLHCAACADLIEQAVGQVAGVTEVQVNSAAQRARVVWNPQRTTASALVRAVRAAGYDAVPDAAAEARELRRRERRAALWRLFVASFCAMQVMMFATPSYVSAAGDLAPDLRQLLNWGSWLVSMPVLLFSAGPFFSGAWHHLRSRRIGMDVPVALGVAVTFLASSVATFDPAGPLGAEVYFDSFTMFISFLLLGRYLEMSVRHRAAEGLERTLSGMPETSWRVLPDGTVETISVLRVRVGDQLRVPLGAVFPADGQLLSGDTTADESVLTGESRPVAKTAGDDLVAGSVNLGVPVDMRVERVGNDTRYQAIVALMRDALSQRPALARRADAMAAPFLWAVLLLAAGAALVWTFIDPQRAVWVAVSVLIVTCPCALSLAAPSALVASTAALARHGVLLQRLDALEALARMTRLFVDKTGTLTGQGPQATTVRAVPGMALDPAEVSAAQSLALWSSHPVAEAVGSSGAGAAPEWQQVTEQVGQGLEGQDPDGQCWRLGSWHWVADGRPLPGSAEPDSASRSGCYFGRRGEPHLHFSIDESLREGARQAVQALQGDGVTLCLVSGDAPARVERLARRLGIDSAFGGASPQDKLDRLTAAQDAGEVVGMLGDGVNDAPVLARADVSIAMGQGALVSRLHADAVLVSNQLPDLVSARHLARRTIRVIDQNLIWAAVYNGVCIPLALVGWLPPWAAGLGMACSSLLVVANSLRLGRHVR